MPTHYEGTPRETLALNTFIKLTRAVGSMTARLQRRSAHEGLTESQFGVLETLYHLGSMCQNEISAKLLTSAANLTLVIDNLEKRDLVRRRRLPEDRRMVQVDLTPTGRDLIAAIFPAHVAAIVEELSVLTPSEQEQLGEFSRKLGKRERISE